MDNNALKTRIADLGFNANDDVLISKIMEIATTKISDSTIRQAWRERQKQKQEAEKAAKAATKTAPTPAEVVEPAVAG